MAREVLSNGVINPDKYQADWYADLSNNWNLLNNLIGSAISGSEVDSKIATAVQELMVRTFQIVAELPQTGTEGVMYLVLISGTSKYTAYVWENNAYRELGVIQMTITIDDELSTTSENPVQNKVITNALGGKASSSHTHSASDITSGLATVATSGSYNDLSNKPTIPTVNDATLTIQQNGTNVQTFTANASANATANIQCVDLSNNQTIAGNKEFTGTTTAHDLVPSATDTYNFGSPSVQWNNAYIKSLTINGVACGDILTHNVSEFVDVSSNQTIGGVKAFSKALTVKTDIAGDVLSLIDNSINASNEDENGFPLTGHTNSIKFRGYIGNIIPCMLTGQVFTSGDTSAELRVYKYKDIQSANARASIVLRYFYVNDISNITLNGIANMYPSLNNTTNLGVNYAKWKSVYTNTINEINPGALSLPSSSYVNVDTTNWDLTCQNELMGSFTPTADGWLMLHIANSGTNEVNFWIIGEVVRINNKSTLNTSDNNNFNMITIPVEKDKTYNIYGNASEYVAGRSIAYCRFMPCQGNV